MKFNDNPKYYEIVEDLIEFGNSKPKSGTVGENSFHISIREIHKDSSKVKLYYIGYREGIRRLTIKDYLNGIEYSVKCDTDENKLIKKKFIELMQASGVEPYD